MTGQPSLEAYFAEQSSYWRDIYEGSDVNAVVYRQRREIALAWACELATIGDVKTLEVGCGAGFLAVALARRGFDLTATDPIPDMLELARRHATDAGLGDRIVFSPADARALPFADASFDLVIALGVLPWLRGPDLALVEMARVLRPQGAFIGSVDAAERLHHRFDPKLTPVLAGARRRLKRVLGRKDRPDAANSALHSIAEFDRMLTSAGLVRRRTRGFGYGPFTVFGRPLLPAREGILLHRWLQDHADRGASRLARVPAQHIVLAYKSS